MSICTLRELGQTLGILLLHSQKLYSALFPLWLWACSCHMLNILQDIWWNKCILYRMSCELWFALTLHIIMHCHHFWQQDFPEYNRIHSRSLDHIIMGVHLLECTKFYQCYTETDSPCSIQYPIQWHLMCYSIHIHTYIYTSQDSINVKSGNADLLFCLSKFLQLCALGFDPIHTLHQLPVFFSLRCGLQL